MISQFSLCQTFGELNKELNLLYKDGNYQGAIIVAEKAKEIAFANFGIKDSVYKDLLFKLGILNSKLDNNKKAASYYLEAIKIYDDDFAAKDLAYANLKYNLGYTALRSLDYKKALIYFVETFNLFYLLETLPPDYTTFLNDFAYTYTKVGDYKKAEMYYLEALRLEKKTSRTEPTNYATIINNLGKLYFDIGDYKKAETFFLDAMYIYKKALGVEHPDYALSLNNLGELYSDIGDYKKSEFYSLQSLAIRKKTLGLEHPDYALSLNNLGNLYSKLGDYQKSELYSLEAMAIRKKILGVDHPDYAISLNNLGALNSTVGKFKKAESYYLESSVINKKVFGPEHTTYALSLNNLGHLYSDIGDFGKSETFYLEAMRIYEKVKGTDHPQFALALNNLGMLYLEKGDYKKAESFLLESSVVYKKAFGIKNTDYSLSLNNLGRVYSEMGYHSKAETYYLEALAIRKETLGNQHPAYATSLNNLASLYLAFGEYKKAETYLLESFAICKKVFGTEHPDYAISLNNLGEFYYEVGDFKKAESYGLEALNVRKNVVGMNHPHYAVSLGNLAKIYYTMGDGKKAESFNLESLAITKRIWGTEHPGYAIILNNLGVFYANINNYEKAQSFHLQALNIRKKIFGNEHAETAQSLDNLGAYYLKTNDYAKSETSYLAALAIRKKIFGVEHSNYALSLNNLGALYLTIGDYKKSEPYFIQSNDIFKKVLGIQHPNYALSLNNLGLIHYQAQNIPLSFAYLNEALSITNKNTELNFKFLGEQDKTKYLKTISFNYDLYRSVFYSSFPESITETIKFYDNELQNKGQVLISSLRIKNAVFKSNDSRLVATWNQLAENKRQLAKIYSLPKDKYPDNTGLIEEDANKLDKKLVNEFYEYRFLSEKLQINSNKIKENLKHNEAALEFISFPFYSAAGTTDSIIYGALLQRSEYIRPKFIFLFEEQQLSKLLKKEVGKSDQSFINDLYKIKDGDNQLAKLIWQPLDSLLIDVKTIYAAPAGLLHKIALGAIPTAEGVSISTKYGLRIVGTTGDILHIKEDFISEKSIEEAIVFGGINYDIASSKPLDFTSISTNNISTYVPTDSTRGATGKWNYLKGTLNEAIEVADGFKMQKVKTHFYSDSTATETLFKNMPVSANRIIHIATHGYFFPDIVRREEDGLQLLQMQEQTAFKSSENPLLRSGLIFAGANPSWTNSHYVSTATDDGILTAYEISNMDLNSVKLVVLSACETGLGDIKGSEGVFGLQRSFKLAGVKNIIMSLWKVPDEKTRELMQSFYQFCFSGKSISEAFNAAQDKMRITYPASPYYWAGFTLLQ